MESWSILHCICVMLVIPTCAINYHYDRLGPRQAEMSRTQHQRYTQTFEYKWESSGGGGGAGLGRGGNVTEVAATNRTSTRIDAKDVKQNVRDSIVFPTESTVSNHQFAPQVTEDCKKGKTLCLSVPNYPSEYIDSLISNLAEEWQSTTDQLVQEEIKINQRIGDDPDEFELCDYRETVVYPKAAENTDKKWLTIINTPRHAQGFRIELCREEGSSCNQAAAFPIGMTGYCKQKYVLREMTALDATGQIVRDHFRLPSCCTCVVRYNNFSKI